MENELPVNTAFVTDNDISTIVCPSCYSAKTTSVKQFRNKSLRLKVKCKCGHVFKIELEFRRNRRKGTELDARTRIGTSTYDSRLIRVVDLSMGGARLEVQGVHDIQVGDQGTIDFTLDDRKRSVIKKQIIVRTVQKNQIGCEFFEDQQYQKDLGFYLRF